MSIDPNSHRNWLFANDDLTDLLGYGRVYEEPRVSKLPYGLANYSGLEEPVTRSIEKPLIEHTDNIPSSTENIDEGVVLKSTSGLTNTEFMFLVLILIQNIFLIVAIILLNSK